MLKALTTIVLFGLLVGMTIRAVFPKQPTPKRPGPRIQTARKCPDCGAYRLGGGACPTPDCPSKR